MKKLQEFSPVAPACSYADTQLPVPPLRRAERSRDLMAGFGVFSPRHTKDSVPKRAPEPTKYSSGIGAGYRKCCD